MSGVARALRAYPTLLRVGFAGAVAYRAEMVVWMLTTTMPLVSLALWSAVAAGGPVGRFGARELTAYFLGTLVVRQLTGSWLVWEMNMEIKSGALSQRLLKPMHPLVVYSAENLAALPLRAVLCAPIAVIGVAVAGADVLPGDAPTILLWCAAMAGAWLINFFTMALIGALAFVIESSTAVFEVYLAIFMVLSGYVVPLELFPAWLRAISDVLPFRYTLAFPVEVGTGLIEPGRALRDLGVQWLYVGTLCAAALGAWRAGLRRFAAFGG
jgi:ABC-2 type transport system permease protein